MSTTAVASRALLVFGLLAFGNPLSAGDLNGDGTDDVLWQNVDGQVHCWPIRDGQRIDGVNISDPVGSV